MSDTTRSQFVLALLSDLQQRGYSPDAWRRFFANLTSATRSGAAEPESLNRSC
ncbi:MAG TPA: hypothetical protein VH599_11400 [Ktedonobacterales bacterium]